MSIERIGVVGAGTMGHGLAQVFAAGGYSVHLTDVDPGRLDLAVAQIRANLEVLAEAGAIADGEIAPILERIQTGTAIEESPGDADLAIEAVPEDPGIKREVFQRLDRRCPAPTILLSNTSCLNVFEIAPEVRPERFCIAHWYAPPYILPLVDVVRGPGTSTETIDTVVDLLRGLGKKPVVLERFFPGYLANRLQVALSHEVSYLLDNGYATAEQVDEAATASLAPRMMALGLVKRMDYGGLDVCLAIQKNMVGEIGHDPEFREMRERIDRGHLGVKTGKGFYDYADRTTTELTRERDLALLKILGSIS